jgi:cellulose synthase/poly-beta-1,6-N-acetylglucosamine synthase-like glycosyltransferase
LKAHIIKDSSKQNTPANKTIRLTGKGPYHGHPIRLTIGLIVKNEEKTLDRCLSSLQPLMQAVESELIITDTGSTDRTVEIAKKYTDHIIQFSVVQRLCRGTQYRPERSARRMVYVP